MRYAARVKTGDNLSKVLKSVASVTCFLGYDGLGHLLDLSAWERI